MTINNKTRKILWGRSGNRCAICKKQLVIDATLQDNESIIGEECHIIASGSNGPRHDSSYPAEKLDSYKNLILLCRIHHKMIDDQVDTYSANILRLMKSNHEVWVSQKLDEKNETKPIKIKRIKQNIPAYLSRLISGKEVLDLVTNTMGYAFDHGDLETQGEVDLIGSFLQTVENYGEISDCLETADRVQIGYDLTELLKDLENAGFFVFGGREMQVLEGGIQASPSDWPIAILTILRKDSQEIMKKNKESGHRQ